jgi:uncharacterized protein (UPF0335 family)
MSDEKRDGSNEKKPDLSEMFDLTRDKAVNNFVDSFESLHRQKDAIAADIKQLKDDAKEAMFSKTDIKAMETVAKWRKDDKKDAGREMIAALKRVSNAAKFDLFSWADTND